MEQTELRATIPKPLGEWLAKVSEETGASEDALATRALHVFLRIVEAGALAEGAAEGDLVHGFEFVDGVPVPLPEMTADEVAEAAASHRDGAAWLELYAAALEDLIEPVGFATEGGGLVH